MSTGADCYFTEKKPRRWFYKIQDYPYGETEEYKEHGPFNSFAKAERHLSITHANPGAYSVESHPGSNDYARWCKDN